MSRPFGRLNFVLAGMDTSTQLGALQPVQENNLHSIRLGSRRAAAIPFRA